MLASFYRLGRYLTLAHVVMNLMSGEVSDLGTCWHDSIVWWGICHWHEFIDKGIFDHGTCLAWIYILVMYLTSSSFIQSLTHMLAENNYFLLTLALFSQSCSQNSVVFENAKGGHCDGTSWLYPYVSCNGNPQHILCLPWPIVTTCCQDIMTCPQQSMPHTQHAANFLCYLPCHWHWLCRAGRVSALCSSCLLTCL